MQKYLEPDEEAEGQRLSDESSEQLSEAYVHSLASLGLERLQNEPGRLHAEAIAVDEALHSLSLNHYRVFIQNQECVRHVQAQGMAMDSHLSALLSDVHGLGAEFSVFQREAAELVGGHKRNRQTLKHHMQIVELLEIPQLMDACVRSDLLEEALSIATFAGTLEARHRNRRPPASSSAVANAEDATAPIGRESDSDRVPEVIRMIVDEVKESARGLHERLLAKLRGPIQLTSCLQVVSCLRRLEILALEERNARRLHRRHRRILAQQATDSGEKGSKSGPLGRNYGSSSKESPTSGYAMNGAGPGTGGNAGGVTQRQLALVEMKLQVDFLEARDAWLADAASRAGQGHHHQALVVPALASAATSPHQILMDLIENSRSQWFEVATQFKAIFSSVEGAAAATARRSFNGGTGADGLGTAGPSWQPESGDVLSLWLLLRVNSFVDRLKALLPLVEDGGSLRSLLEESMFFGASMGRLGADFRGLLVPVFEERVCSVAAEEWTNASAAFVVTLRDIAAIEAAGGNGSSLLHVPDKISASFGGAGDKAPATAAASAAAAAANSSKETSSRDDDLRPPPKSLMAFPPVARLLNHILSSFNQLRECLPTSVEDRLADALVACLADCFEALADLQKSTVRANAAVSAASSGSSNAAASSARYELNTTRAVELACVSLAGQAVPHLATCFAVLFGDDPARDSAASASALAGGKGQSRAGRLRSLLLKAMEAAGIYEPPAPPPEPAPSLREKPRPPAPLEGKESPGKVVSSASDGLSLAQDTGDAAGESGIQEEGAAALPKSAPEIEHQKETAAAAIEEEAEPSTILGSSGAATEVEPGPPDGSSIL